MRETTGRPGRRRLGRGWPWATAGLVAAAALGVVATRATRPARLDCGGFALVATGRVGTGLQRAERVVFADGGRLLAVSCPRYERVVLYRVGEGGALRRLPDLALDGRPVALAATRDRILVLQRPGGDARHVEAGSCAAFDFDGRRVGSRVRVGFDPDDLAVSADGRLAVVATSGRAEGESNRPAPALAVYDLSDPSAPRRRGAVAFDDPRDDPERVVLDPEGRSAAVALKGSDVVARIDVTDPDRPRVVGRRPMPGGAPPGAIGFDSQGHLLAAEEGGRLWDLGPGAEGEPKALWTGVGEFAVAERFGEAGLPGSASFRAAPTLALGRLGGDRMPEEGSGAPVCFRTNPSRSTLDVVAGGRTRGALPLRGSANLGGVRPMGLAVCAERGLVAVADRSGGVHLIVAERPAGR